MGLSSDLISQFVKITNDKKETPKETTVYGTVVEYEGKSYVQMDGSELLTPVSTTTDLKDGERVTVMIKNHTATVTGNITSPSASGKDLQNAVDEISEFEIIIAKKADVDALNAEKARIDTLTSENVTIKETLTANSADIDKLQASTLTVTEKLTAAEANIVKLEAEKIDVLAADAKFATIENLNATNTDVYNLNATYADFASATADRLAVLEGEIERLEAGEITVEQLKATFATIVQLEAEQARIAKLEGEVADIDTLIFGSATGSTIQTSFANAVIAQLGDAQIKSAMIDNINASKITSGDIITNDVRVLSEDGKLLISDETIQISDNTRVRVQIGKDTAGDYSINIWDAEGNLMFSEGGITDSAIKEAIIRNDMVSDTANIAAHKLDIDSLFEEINGSTQTIKSSRIYLDDQAQTLDVAFETMSTDIENIQNGVSSQGTQITAMQGQIASKVWQTDIDTAVSEVNETTENLSTQYEEIVQEVDGLTATVSNHASEISKKADSTEVTEVNTKVTSLETDLDGFKTEVSETYVTNTEVGAVNLVNDQLPGIESVGNWTNVGDGWIRCVYDNSTGESISYATYRFPLSEYVTYLPANTQMTVVTEMRDLGSTDGVYAYSYPEDDAGVNRVQIKGSSYVYAINARDGVSVTRTSAAYVMPESESGLEKTSLGGWIVGVPAGAVADVLLRQGIYEGMYTGEYVSPTNDIRSLDSRISSAESSINLNTDNITALVSRTETVENKFDNYSTTSEMTSAIEQSANSITTTVSETYSTKEETEAAVDAIEVGGRNLLLDSETELIVDRNYAHSLAPVELHPDDIFTYSVWLKASEETDDVKVYINDDSGQTRINVYFSYGMTVTTEYQQYVFVGKRVNNMTSIFTADNNIRMRVYAPEGITLTGKLAKLEFGNKVTDWTPAPEDMATLDNLESIQSSVTLSDERLTTAETIIEQLTDSISMLVTDSNGESLMTQTETGWTFSTKEIQDIVDTTSEGLNNLIEEVGDVDSAVGILQQAVDELGILNDYVKITTYEDEPCIELGEIDSDFKLRITNTKILFMEGDDVPAYITNRSLHIKKAVIEEELQQGQFLWKARSNGNLGLVWKEG